MLAQTPAPPYYAVIFTSLLYEDVAGYHEMAEEMHNLAQQQPGFLGVESAREHIGITVSYWRDIDSIKQWKQHARHLVAQRLGKEQWYKHFYTRIALVESDSGTL